MVKILELQPTHLEQVQYLVNSHLGAVVPGWALPLEYIAFCLKRNPSEYVTDPWVWERKSLVALKEGRVCGAAHLLKYGADSPASGSGEIDWFVCWPNETATGAALLSAAEEQLGAWECRESRFDGNLPAPLMSGVPDSWPHVTELISRSRLRALGRSGRGHIRRDPRCRFASRGSSGPRHEDKAHSRRIRNPFHSLAGRHGCLHM